MGNSSNKKNNILDLILQLNVELEDRGSLSLSEEEYLHTTKLLHRINTLLAGRKPVSEPAKLSAEKETPKTKNTAEIIAEKKLSDFTRIQHDIMSPVKSIRGAIELGRMISKTDDIKQVLGIIEKCNSSIEQQLGDLLEILSGTVRDKSAEKIDFHSMLDSILREISHLSGFNTTTFNIDIKNKKTFVSDSRIVSSIIRNLVGNAVKYSNKDRASVVDVKINDSKDGIIIEVRDNGIGISKESLKLIFKPYFRTDSQGEGSGMGLYIVHEAVKALGGSIEVNSDSGTGSSFTVFIPSAL